MCVAPLGGPAGWMKRVAEQHEAGHWQSGIRSGDLRGDPPAHRFAADEERARGAVDVAPDVRNDGSIARLQRRTAIWKPAFPFGVEEVERDRLDAE
jgi:hypothetical protein